MFDIQDNLREWFFHNNFTSIDVEGCGNYSQCPVELSIIHFQNGLPIDHKHWFIKPKKFIKKKLYKNIHGITNNMVKNCPKFSEIKGEVIKELTGRVLVGHHVSSDLSMISNVFPQIYSIPALTFDTSKFFSKIMSLKDYVSLDKIRIILDIKTPDDLYNIRSNFHSSDKDAYDCAQILLKAPTLLSYKYTDDEILRLFKSCTLNLEDLQNKKNSYMKDINKRLNEKKRVNTNDG